MRFLGLQVANFELGSAIGFHLGNVTQFPRKRSYQVLQKCVITGYLIVIFMVTCTAQKSTENCVRRGVSS